MFLTCQNVFKIKNKVYKIIVYMPLIVLNSQDVITVYITLIFLTDGTMTFKISRNLSWSVVSHCNQNSLFITDFVFEGSLWLQNVHWQKHHIWTQNSMKILNFSTSCDISTVWITIRHITWIDKQVSFQKSGFPDIGPISKQYF